MKKFLTALALLCLAIGATAKTPAFRKGLGEYTLRCGGMERTFRLYLPERLSAETPLVFVLHGYGGTANPDRFGMNRVAEMEGFAVCYPQGERDGRGKTCWNVGYPFQKGLRTDDVGFLCRLARYLQRHCGLSRRNTFCTGMSNGGEMCYLLAYLRPDVFSAVAPVSGLTLEWMYRDLCAERAVPLFEIHGTRDRTSAWEGDPQNSGGWGEYIAVPLAVGYWAGVARCTHEEREEIPTKRPDSDNRIIAHRYVGGTDGCEVWLYEIVGGKHSWADKDIDTCAEIWRFFSRFVAHDKKKQ